MLDKTVPYATLYMCRKAGTPVPQFPLPQGFKYTMYRDGDETEWARIETSVAEFDSQFAALMRFNEQFMPHCEELRRRLLFIETEEGIKTATANAWWAIVSHPGRIFPWQPKQDKDNPDRRAWLHWIAVSPEHQGLGLGKAVVSRAMRIMLEIEGDTDMYLRTQTWSYKAINIYKKCGFEPTDEKILYTGKRRHDYAKALKILNQLGIPKAYRNEV